MPRLGFHMCAAHPSLVTSGSDQVTLSSHDSTERPVGRSGRGQPWRRPTGQAWAFYSSLLKGAVLCLD